MIIRPRGSQVPLSGTTLASRPELAGTVIEDEVRPLELSPGQMISLQTRVVRAATGTLDFYYRITATEVPITSVLLNIVWSEEDVDYRLDGLGDVGPSRAYYFLETDLDPPGSRPVGALDPYWWIVFDFSPAVSLTQQSRFFFVKTVATSYRDGVRIRLNWGVPSPTVFGPIHHT